MSDAPQSSSANEWLERLRSVLPAYRGYADQTSRREQDALYRRYLSDRVGGLLAPLEQLIGERAHAGQVIEVLPLERVREKLRALLRELEAPDYGTTAFFNERPVDETVLDLLYQYDLVLNEHVQDAYAQLEGLRAHPPEGLLLAAERLEATVLALEAEFESRCEVIRNWT
ncbi:MAG: hypothetical protein N0A16_12260 [Blastocatellia bacterium]|nr:hypothetical protein [Blastocatellia bacterium]MCS7158485.1 hypothetical protein [Blastocatellia bacterium]MCX7753444.1 hypothetical protein [Blastocatellia bacterium]MDW8167834.1 hypothetical protein [Acidobacteriota bacterium]MDW8255869.1 hypothetical protein [Acidobacteriota bacterium]